MLKYLHVMVLISSLFINTNLNAQWVQTKGPKGGTVYCLTVIPADSGKYSIFAGTYSGGIHLSTDNGKSWKAVNNWLTVTDINSIVSKGNKVFAGGAGVFLSTDNGSSWTKMNNGLSNLSVNSLLVKGDNIFAGLGDGIYISKDDGQNWIKLDNGYPNIDVYDLAMKDSVIFAAIYGRIIRSTDNGTTWTSIGQSVLPPAMSVAFASKGKYFYAGMDGGLFRSTDYGDTWARSDSGLPRLYLDDIAVNGNDLFIATGYGLFKSTNEGTSWAIADSMVSHIYPRTVKVFGENILLGTHVQGMYLSTDYGRNWSEVNDGFVDSYIDQVASDDSGLFAYSNPYGLYYSPDKGDNWEKLKVGISGSPMPAIQLYEKNVYIGWWGFGVKHSTDYGKTWEYANYGLKNDYVSSLVTDGTNLFAGTRNGVFVSTDNGTNWTEVSSGLSDKIIQTLMIDGDKIFAGTYSEGVFCSTDKGQSWQPYNWSLIPWYSNNYIISLKKLGTGLAAATYKGVYIFNSKYNRWVECYPRIYNLTCLAASGNNLFVGTSEGVLLSSDMGETWAHVDSGLYLKSVRSFTIMGNDIFAGTFGGGVFRRPLSEMITTDVSRQDKGEVPYSFRLMQNYPNPFNPSTTISYSIPVGSNVKLVVYDLLGRELTTLVNEYNTAGMHSVQFNASDFPSGMYIYSIQAEHLRDSKKFVVLK